MGHDEVGEERKVVWILGAGFSVPLGGPLFRSLISGEMLRTLQGWGHYATQTNHYINRLKEGGRVIALPAGVFSNVVCGLYQAGLANPGDAARLWGDAEEFLDRLAIAASEPNSMLAAEIRSCIQRIGKSWTDVPINAIASSEFPHGLTVLHTEALRFIAGACTAFLLRADENPKVVDESEQWEPYRRWYRCLVAGADEVMTFNYDRAPDLLSAYGRRQRPAMDLFLSPVSHPGESFDALRPQCVPLYHLHGHVGWKTTEGGRAIEVDTTAANDAIAYIEPDRAVIGIPGRHKLTLPTGLLKDIWDRAMRAIEDAHAVVMVGYRFPETDNMAKSRIFAALKKNPDAMVHVVLGANNLDMPRVRGMLEWTRSSAAVRVHEMFAQDFFAVFEREGVF